MKQIKFFRTTAECDNGRPVLTAKFRSWVALDKEKKTPYWKGRVVVPTYQVTFYDINGKQIGQSQYVREGNSATAPTPPNVVGHTFNHWDTDFTSVTSELNVHAVYDILSYSVKFFDEDGTTLLQESTIDYGGEATPPTPLSKVGKSFKQWSTIDYTLVKKDLIVKAVYEDLTYSVSFYDYNGVLIETQTIKYGEDATAPTPPTPSSEDYAFVSWDKTFTNVTSDIDVYAQQMKKVSVYNVEFVEEIDD